MKTTLARGLERGLLVIGVSAMLSLPVALFASPPNCEEICDECRWMCTIFTCDCAGLSGCEYDPEIEDWVCIMNGPDCEPQECDPE